MVHVKRYRVKRERHVPDLEDGAGNVAGEVASEEEEGVGTVLRLANTYEGIVLISGSIISGREATSCRCL